MGLRPQARVAALPQSIRQALQPLRFALIAATLFSLGINLMMLVSPIYLMQVFDRVLSSGSLHTLLWLSLLAVACLAVYGTLDMVRSRILSKTGLWLETEMTGRLIRNGVENGGADGTRPLRDLGQVRAFLSSPSIHAAFDAPWALLFLAVMFLLHPWYGAFSVGALLLLLIVATVGDSLTRRLSSQTGEGRSAALAGAESALRNADIVRAMGMMPSILERWTRAQSAASGRQDALDERSSFVSGLSKFVRITVQTAIIGIGAILVMRNEASAGSMIAASVMLGRALAPVDMAIGSWKQIASVRAAWQRINAALRATAMEVSRTRLPKPLGQLSLEAMTLQLPGASEAALDAISFELEPGASLAIVGPSGAGKSLLCKVMCGILAPTSGYARVDHAALTDWPEADLRPHVGYLPQDIALFPGTVAENIARLSDASSEDIVAAARLADVHELILRLPDGYETDVGTFGHLLSGGQRQRIGLARAVFGDPRLVVLDEPNSNLDPAGEAALLRALEQLKARGCTVVVVSHKLGIVQSLDRTLLLQDGAVQALGPSDKVLSILMGREPSAIRQAPSSSTSVATS